MNNSLVFGKDSSNISRAAKCTTDGKFIMDIDKSNDVATETTLRQVKTAIENIDVNVGDITLGEITVASNDTTTHEKLDINNGLISSTNSKLDTLNSTLTNKHLNKLTDSIDISGQTITVANLSTVAKESTLSNINQNIPQMESDNDNRLKINTEGQSISVSNNVLVNGTVVVGSGSISVSNFPSNQQVFGSVNVSNMITDYATNTNLTAVKSSIDNKHLNSGTDSVSVVGAVSVSNFPSSQTVNGTVNVSTLPAIEITNTSFEVSNFPATQPVSGTVAVSNTSFEISNLPATQPVSGTVAVSSLPAIGITNTSFGVSNFPANQVVSGTVDVATLPAIGIINTSFEVSNFPATQPVSGTVAVSNTSFEVSNFPATQPISGSVIVSNLPATQPISGSVSISNLPTTQPVSGTVAVSNTSFEVSNFPATQPVSGTVAVSSLPAIGITNTSFEVSNFPATQPVSGTVAVSSLPAIGITNTSFEVSNFPATQPVSGTVAVSSLPAIGITNTSFEVSNFPATQPVSGSVSILNLPATQPVSGTVAISNSVLTVETGTNNPLDVNITGGTLTGANGKAYLYSGDEASSISATVVSGKTGIDSNIINSSIDVHNYASSNGTTWHHLACDSNGQLNVHAKMQDGAGNDVSSTTLYSKTALDTASNMYADYAGSRKNVSCDTNGKLQVNSFLKSGAGDSITSTDTTATTMSIDTASCLYTTDATIRKALTSSTISAKEALDVNVSNSGSISVYDNAVDLAIDGLTTVCAEIRGYDLITAERTTSIKTSTESMDAKLDINNNKLDLIFNEIETDTGLLQDIKNNTVSIDGKLSTTTNTSLGLNVYPILPLGKTYTFSGVGSTGAYIVFAGSPLSTLTITSQSWGLANPKSWYAKCSVARTLNYEYIDDTGATGTGTISLSAGVYSGVLPLQGGGSGTNKIVGINRWWVTSNLAIGDTVLISATSASDSNAIAGGGPTYSNIGVFTCPAGCRAFISNVNVGLSQSATAAADTVRLFHFTTGGIRTVRHVLANVYTAQSYNINSGNAYGSIGGWLEPGEAFMWAGQSGDANITQRNISCQIMCINY